METKEWTIGRITLPQSVRGLSTEVGPVTFLQGHLLVVAGANVYSMTLDTTEDEVSIRAELLGPLGKVQVKGFERPGVGEG